MIFNSICENSVDQTLIKKILEENKKLANSETKRLELQSKRLDLERMKKEYAQVKENYKRNLETLTRTNNQHIQMMNETGLNKNRILIIDNVEIEAQNASIEFNSAIEANKILKKENTESPITIIVGVNISSNNSDIKGNLNIQRRSTDYMNQNISLDDRIKRDKLNFDGRWKKF
ncbi:unnamed protein product [Macrosiphum euphorbiae]|uniref:Uncharacterized protein n=1 Tax=Macrosiphum euphorbiae TaxID=13131 RepID=A0AAV0XLA0_9HEMI|nr:unnamed protein product [Macrosiphum euphorbiae]